MAALIAGLAQLDVLGAAARKRLYRLAPEQLQALAAHANKAAGITCSRPGADPPQSADLGLLPVRIPAREGKPASHEPEHRLDGGCR